MQLHRPSTFGVGMGALPVPGPGSPGNGGLTIGPLTLTPYDGWNGPVSDRESTLRQLAWVDERVAAQASALKRARQRQTLVAGDAMGSEAAAALSLVREVEAELRTLEAERRGLQRKMASLDRKDRERLDAEEAQRHRYHKLTAKRTSVIAVPNLGLSHRHVKRQSIMAAPVFVPGFDPALALQVQDASDLNLDSPLDQELLLERMAARVKRDSLFEQQFGGLSGVGEQAPPSRSSTRRNSVASSSRPRASPRPPNAQFIIEESEEDDEDDDDDSETDDSDEEDSGSDDPSSEEDVKPAESASSRMLDRRSTVRRSLPQPVYVEEKEQVVAAPSSPRRRPAFLTQAAELSASDLSSSLQNYISLSELAPASITATEALIDPHLREKLSKTLQAYIKASAAAALASLEAMDSASAATPAAVAAAASASPPAPSREEQLLWGLLMGTLRNEEEEQLAIEWWADREKQLFAEATARTRRLEDANSQRRRTLRRQASHRTPGAFPPGDHLFSLDGLQLQLGADHAAHMLSGKGPSSVHMARGALLNALSMRQEELRHLRGGLLLAQMALKAALEAQRLKDHVRTHGLASALIPTPVAPHTGSSIEPMCRRFVLSVVHSALANAGILARQERTLRDLKWALSKARRVRQLTLNGSINRPPDQRPKWISAVSQPTCMPKLDGPHLHSHVLRFLAVEPELPSQAATKPATATSTSASAAAAATHPKDDAASPVVSSPSSPNTTATKRSADAGVASMSQAVLAASKAAYIDLPGGSESGEPSSEEPPPAAFPERDVRPGRGWTDPLYTPVPFDAVAAETARRRGVDVVYPPPALPPQRKVVKQAARPVSTRFLESDEDSEVEGGGAFAGMPNEVPEDDETKAAIATWTEMQAKAAAALAARRGRRGSSSLVEEGWPQGLGHEGLLQQAQVPTQDPSLLGSPPALHVSPALVDEWSLFVKSLDAASLAAKTAGSLLRGGDMVTGGVAKDPTAKSDTKTLNANERFAAAATAAANPFADIPPKHLPRGAYHGLTPVHPHPDRQGDANAWIMSRSRALSARARKLASAGDGGQALVALQASRAAMASHFHASSNSWDFFPIDPSRPARKCPASCTLHYEVDRAAATPTNPLGAATSAHAHVTRRPASASARAGSRAPTRPTSPRRPATAARRPKMYASATSSHGSRAVRTVISYSPRRAASPTHKPHTASSLSPSASPSPSPSPYPPSATSRPGSSWKRKMVAAPRAGSAVAAMADLMHQSSRR